MSNCDDEADEWDDYDRAKKYADKVYKDAWQAAVEANLDLFRKLSAGKYITEESMYDAFLNDIAQAQYESDTANANLEWAGNALKTAKKLECEYRQKYIDCLEEFAEGGD